MADLLRPALVSRSRHCVMSPTRTSGQTPAHIRASLGFACERRPFKQESAVIIHSRCVIRLPKP